MQHDAALGKKMSAHRITHAYLEVIAQNANQSVQSLRPQDTWVDLGINDDDTMRRIAMQLQIVAASENPQARITVGEVVGAKDVAGGLILTWEAAALGTLTRELATAEIEEAQREHADAAARRERTEEVVVTAAKRKKTTKKKRKKKVAGKKAAKKKRAKKPKPKRGAKRARPAKKK